jgi:class 3 adenylate cyclase
VTVLFADVKSHMDMAERVEIEAWHLTMDRFFVILCEGVHRFEGTVTQFTGDGVMALFGAPIAHEDHARRACYAALHLGETLAAYAAELRRGQGLNFSVRIGLNSGEVVVGSIGEDLRVDYTAIGHSVGLAKRMEQLAEPGKIYLTENAAALASGYFQLADLGEFEIKGAARPLRVYELQGVGELRTRLDMSRMRGFTRFVGRQDEMATLEAALALALEGRGQVVGVVGEAGVGKSRLCYEFAQYCRARDIPVREAHGLAHGKAVPFLPVLELMRGFYGISERDGGEAAREKIAGRLLLLDTTLEEALPLMFEFMGVPDPERPSPVTDAEARQRQLFAVLKRGMQARSEREPAVHLMEDLHWFDGGSEAWVEAWVEAVPSTRTLLLVNFRPDYHAPWMQKSYYRQLPLLPLGPEAIEELLRDLLGSDPSLWDLSSRIQERTRGNPFFMEEVVMALVESGSLEGMKGAYRLVKPPSDEEMPTAVQTLLAARIDRLADREKRILQTASGIGKEFAELVLRRVADLPEGPLMAALDALTSAEFVYEQALYPEATYAFKHPLTQEVAYRSQAPLHQP